MGTTMTGSKTMTSNATKLNVFFLCRKGQPASAMRLDREPTARELEAFAVAGLELAAIGACYKKTVACPVNGDGYWYTRRYLLDSAGEIVGSVEDAQGPRG
jgi:hypothetical protein